jgi:hypothetical protein
MGLNRIFTGLLLDQDNRLCLATSGTHSQARVSRILNGEIDVSKPRYGEYVSVELSREEPYHPQFVVSFGNSEPERFDLTLTRFEFVMRVADGALPTSFSKECFEDIAAFKTQLVEALHQLEHGLVQVQPTSFRILRVGPSGEVSFDEIKLKFTT